MELVTNLVVENLIREHSIKRRLTLSYLLYIFIFILFVGVLSNFLIQKQYRSYAEQKQKAEITQIVSEVESQYLNDWNVNNIQVIGTHELDNGYIISVYDVGNKKLWDAETYNNNQCMMIMNDIKSRMKKNNPNWNGKYVLNQFPLTLNGRAIGTIEIGYYSPYFYTNEDFNFLATLNSLYLLSSIIFLFFALILGAYMARRLSKPLSKVVLATSNISNGIYEKIPYEKTNITEINQLTNSINSLTQALEDQELLRKQLTSDVTHELRTPLTTLQTHIEAMIDGILETDTLQLNSIYEEIIRLNTIVKDLDKLLHYDKGNVLLHKEYLNLSDLIQSVITIFAASFLQKNIKLIFEGKQAYMLVDKDKMSQVFINLISNALKYTQSGQVIIKVIDKKNDVFVTVEDTGIGINEKDLSRIFERFYRAEKSRDRKTGGTGIGLTIAKSIVNAHKGTITAESKKNIGTKMTIYLPKID